MTLFLYVAPTILMTSVVFVSRNGNDQEEEEGFVLPDDFRHASRKPIFRFVFPPSVQRVVLFGLFNLSNTVLSDAQ